MKNKIVILIIIILFIGFMVFASFFVNKYSVIFWGNYNSGDESNANLTENLDENNKDSADNTDKNNENSTENLDEIKEEEKMEVINLTNENFEAEVLKSEKTVLIDFYADWCMPCKMMAPVVDAVAKENSDIKVGKINIDNEENLAIKYQVMSIPTFIVIKNGEVVNRIVGVVDKAELESSIK